VSRRRALADVLQAMQLLRSEQAAAYTLAGEDEAFLGGALVEAGLVSERERIEAVGLAFQLPTVDLREHPPRAGLDALFDIDMLRSLRVLPLWSAPGELFVACDSPPTVEAAEQLDALLGLVVTPVLVAPDELSRLLAELRGDETIAAGEIATAVRRQRLATPSQIDAAERVSRQTGEPFANALGRFAGVTPAAMQEALARTHGWRVFREDRAETATVPPLPRALALRLRAVPVASEGRRVVAAMTDPWDVRVRRALQALLNADVEPAICDERQLQRLVQSLADRAEALPAGDARRTAAVILQGAFVDTTQEILRDIDLTDVSGLTVARLWQAMDDRSRSEAAGLDAGLPRIEALLLHPHPAAATARLAAAAGTPMLPVLQLDEVLTVAIAAPDAIEPAQDLASAQQLALRVAIASGEGLNSALEDLGAVDLRAIAAGYVSLGRVLEQRHGIARRDVLMLFQRMASEPIDTAIVRMQLMSPEGFAGVLGETLGTTALALSRADEGERTSGAGARATRRVLRDPVDHDVARRLTPEDVQRMGALPVSERGGGIVVAMADPLDTAAVAAVRERLGSAIEIRPATRADIHEAMLRAHGRTALGDQLLESGLVSRAQLSTALDVANRTGVRIGEALISLGILSEDELGEALARQRGMPFFAMRGLDLDPLVLRLLPEAFAREHRMLPILRDDAGAVTVAVEDPNDEAAMQAAREIIGRPVTFAVTTRSDVRDALERLYHGTYLEHSAMALVQTTPENSAYKVVTRPQKVVLLGLSALIFISVIFWTVPALTVLLALSTAFYLAFSSYKFYLIYRALSHTLEVPITQEMVDELDDRELPVYTILIPLYRETAVLPMLVRGLSRLDYPKEKLDVKLLLEEDDAETIAVARLANLPPYFDITIVPDGKPKGKPKACNYGLLHARGEFVVIFDAEDIPEPDQLKKVLVAFRMSAPNVVCIQTKLNYYNRNQNVLTKWFTTEYSTWFDLFLPGLDASGAPIPLGGTSNHFRIDALRAAGAWDPFNVTEDADLGLRIFKLGGSTAVVDSTTYEEANSVLDNWIRQRSRWVKGYIQTYLVHMRHPWELMRTLGLGGFISFQLVIGGTFFGFLLNPLLWGLTGVWFATKWSVIQDVFPAPVYYMGAISLYAGNFAFAYMNVAGCLRRRYYSLVKWALLSPVYWVLMSIAAWKGFLQLFYRPFYWEKTIHGLANTTTVQHLAGLNPTEAR
jgi:cellulose synthase/poly-beta-1,6-N-acetylglucosamine synthase-like glycosyltransferase